MVKKDLIVAVLATFCLTVMLFIVVPTKSQTAQYDPWVDLDGDGQISIYDVVQMTSIYGMSGDSTKYVNVTNWPTMQPEPAYKIIKMPVCNISFIGGTCYAGFFGNYVGGFSKAFILISPVFGPAGQGTYTVKLQLCGVYWDLDEYGGTPNEAFQGIFPYNSTQSPVATGEVDNGYLNSIGMPRWSEGSYLGVKAPFMSFTVSGTSTTSVCWVSVQVTVYLRSD